MVLRYYKVHSNSEEELSALERNIMGCVFRETDRPSESAQQEKAAPLSDFAAPKGENQSENQGEQRKSHKFVPTLEILYRRQTEVEPGKFRLFKKDIPATYTQELVLRVSDNYTHFIDRYLYSSQLIVEEIREVSFAALTLASLPSHPGAVSNYKTHLEGYLTERYPSVKSKISIIRDADWEGRKGDIAEVFLSGPVSEIMELKSFLERRVLAMSEPKIITFTFAQGSKEA